ncbi:DUF6940 family protein [Fodinibius sp.]|uniref:DUF6940 family protein n=1 Tax=Fodinibius sp. TaxID=1872440 RepID=UPI002ACD2EEE|nr:hypothetical protein [Fodinibius sp.]MDZ7659675.1 hypothetical protein [Fodinibius sp.]
MFKFKKSTIEQDKSYKYQLYQQKQQLSYAQFLDLLEQQTEEFRQFFIDLLANLPFRAYHWETPPVTKHSLNKSFEFVVSQTPGINLPPDPEPFQQYFQPGKKVAVFDNLGGDAKLIAPTSTEQDLNYSHIGVFTDNAPREQQLALWQTVGKVTKDSISDQPLWLNTAGGGVAWLHVRLDSTSKYYRHRPYTSKS